MLERYRKRLPSFNDDIQGTGAVALAGLLGACALRGRKLRDEVVVVYGAGAGGAGVAWAIAAGYGARGARRPSEAQARVFVLDSQGPARRGARDGGVQEARSRSRAPRVGRVGRRSRSICATTIAKGRATVLLGLSGQPNTFTEPMVRALCANVERPVIFPLSNPTSSCEATPADLLAWSHGRAIVATGSPFDAGERRRDGEVPIGQGNNAFIFPGLGFGAILAEASGDHRRDGARRLRTRSPTTCASSTCHGPRSTRRSTR